MGWSIHLLRLLRHSLELPMTVSNNQQEGQPQEEVKEVEDKEEEEEEQQPQNTTKKACSTFSRLDPGLQKAPFLRLLSSSGSLV